MPTEGWLILAILYSIVMTLLWWNGTTENEHLNQMLDEAAAMVVQHQDAYADLGDQFAQVNMELASALLQLEHRSSGDD